MIYGLIVVGYGDVWKNVARRGERAGGCKRCGRWIYVRSEKAFHAVGDWEVGRSCQKHRFL